MLQGTLEEFSLNQVLNFLASANQSGTLELSGDRGNARMFFTDGQVAGATADGVGDRASLEDAAVEICRYRRANFLFVPGEVSVGPDRVPVEDVLAHMLEGVQAWERMEAVVPSPHHMAYPVARLNRDSVTINKDAWEFLQLVGSGASVRELCAAGTMSEHDATAGVIQLSKLGLVIVAEPDPNTLESLFRHTQNREEFPHELATAEVVVDDDPTAQNTLPDVYNEAADPQGRRASDTAAWHDVLGLESSQIVNEYWDPPRLPYSAPHAPIEPNWGTEHPEAKAKAIPINRRADDYHSYPTPGHQEQEDVQGERAPVADPQIQTQTDPATVTGSHQRVTSDSGRIRAATERLNRYFSSNPPHGR